METPVGSGAEGVSAALAATVGTGNIAGVSAAIVTGGPGAVFWMWFAAFFGMMTKSSENVLGIYYRRKNKDIEPMLSDDPETQAEMAEALKSE